MKRPTRRTVGLTATAALIAGLAVTAVVIQPKAVEMGIQVWEDSGQSGDTLLTTGAPPNYPKQGNLTNVTTGLHNGCNRGINQSSTWNDCISSARITGLPASTKVQFYQGTNYTSTLLKCVDVDGTSNVDLTTINDVISSFRAVGGNC